MLTEHEPRQTTENALTIDIGDKRIVYSRQDWYTNKDIANAIGGNLPIVITQAHRIRINDKSIEFTTLGELNRKGKSAPIGSPQTIVYNEAGFIKAVIALASTKTKPLPRKIHSEPTMHKSPESKVKEPKNPGENSHFPFNPFSSVTLNAKKPQETHRTQPKDRLNMKNPKQILAANSVIKALSHLANGTLKDTNHDIQELLQQAAIEHVNFPRFEDDPTENILTKILDSDSPSRLNRFFRVSLDSMLYDLWDVIDTNERNLKEEKKIIEICKDLKRKGYDKKRVIQEVFTHFRIPIPF